MVRANWIRAGRVGSIAASVLGGHRSPAPEAVVAAAPRVHRVIAEVGDQLPPITSNPAPEHVAQIAAARLRQAKKPEAPLDRGGSPAPEGAPPRDPPRPCLKGPGPARGL